MIGGHIVTDEPLSAPPASMDQLGMKPTVSPRTVRLRMWPTVCCHLFSIYLTSKCSVDRVQLMICGTRVPKKAPFYIGGLLA